VNYLTESERRKFFLELLAMFLWRRSTHKKWKVIELDWTKLKLISPYSVGPWGGTWETSRFMEVRYFWVVKGWTHSSNCNGEVLTVFKHHNWKVYEGVAEKLHVSLASSLGE